MANKRMITSDLFEDDICSESYFTRLLWIGIITAVADDQGRMLDNPAIMRAKIFPLDNEVTDQQISESLKKIGKSIYRYTSTDGKKLIQIVKWWEYQTPSWAAPSRFLPPTNWKDRIKVHIVGNKVRTENWEDSGGFICSVLPTKQDSSIDESEVKSDIKGDGEEKSETPPAPLVRDIQSMIEEVIHLPPSGPDDIMAMDEIEAMNPIQEDIQAAYDFLVGQGKRVTRYTSLPGCVRTAIAKRVQTKPKKKYKDVITGEIIYD